MASGLSPTVQEIKPVSGYWNKLNSASNELLDKYGYDCIKQSVGRIYNDNVSQEIVAEKTKELWEGLYSTLPHELLDKLSEPLVGSPRYILLNGRPITIDLGVSAYDYWSISSQIDFSKIESIVEIGGGYGRLPYMILSLHPHIKYTMCDVEPALSIVKWYLPRVLKGVDVQYTHPKDLSKKYDVAIACNCLHEMTREQVHHYFRFFDKNIGYLYYNCWKDTTMPIDGVRWQRDDYPINDRWSKLFDRDYIKSNYFEALYKIWTT